jgi:nucleotide-binding universal stress UspA family protein
MTIPSPNGRIQAENDLQEEAAPLRIKRILVATDFSEQATLALRIAARLTKQFHSRLHVLYVASPQAYAPGVGTVLPALEALDIKAAQERMHEYAIAIPEVRCTKYEEMVLSGPAVEAIYEATETKGIDLVVVGSHGRSGLSKVFLGSVAEAAVRGLPCPVLVIGPHCLQPFHRLKSILLVTDFSSESTHAAKCSISIARDTGATLTVAHVLPGHMQKEDLLGIAQWQHTAEEMRQLIPRNSLLLHQVHFEILTGIAAEEILALADQKRAGLIVLGTNESTAFADHAAWATLSSIIRGAHCPVLGVHNQPSAARERLIERFQAGRTA